jgi:predicted RNA-binding Zn ribbon-like protein
VTPETLLRLANLTVAVKPGRAPKVHPDPLGTRGSAAVAMGVSEVSQSDLAGLRELQELLVELVDRLLTGEQLDRQVARLAALTRASRAQARLEIAHGRFHQHLEWTDPCLVARLARQVGLELGAIDPVRLRRCGRPECDLLFYDSTRSNTQRWHAESPCGQRERQRRHRRVISVSASPAR